jgi:hypothetical protein
MILLTQPSFGDKIMPIVCIKTYELRCDGFKLEDEQMDHRCHGFEGSQLSRKEMVEEALAMGWLQKGWKFYCPFCRKRFDKPTKGEDCG